MLDSSPMCIEKTETFGLVAWPLPDKGGEPSQLSQRHSRLAQAGADAEPIEIDGTVLASPSGRAPDRTDQELLALVEMPTNILLDKIRTRSGLKWGVPAMLVAIPYLYAASLLSIIIQDDGPGWLNILVLIALWSALKMLWIGPVSLVRLARIRWQEHRLRRAERRYEHRMGVRSVVAV